MTTWVPVAKPIYVPLSPQSKRIPLDRYQEELASNGKPRVRRLSNIRHWEFDLVWTGRPYEDTVQIMNIWNAVHQKAFDYLWPLDGEIYRAKFLQAPSVKQTSFNRYEIVVRLQGER
jgi:hypothetical protein